MSETPSQCVQDRILSNAKLAPKLAGNFGQTPHEVVLDLPFPNTDVVQLLETVEAQRAKNHEFPLQCD